MKGKLRDMTFGPHGEQHITVTVFQDFRADYISRLEVLESQEQLTSAEQAEYNRLVGEVARIMPEANTAISETTGLLEEGAAALRVNVEEWRNLAIAAAESARIESMQKGLTEAYIALYTAQDELTVKKHNASESTLAYVEALNAETEAANALAEAVNASGGVETAEVTAAREALNEAIARTGEILATLTREEAKAGEAIMELQAKVSEAEAGVSAYEEKVGILQESLVEVGEAGQQAADGIKETVDALGDTGEISGEGISDAFASGVQGMSESAASEMNATQEIVSSKGEAIAATATDVGTQAASGLQDGISDASELVSQAMSDVNQSVTSSASEGRAAGFAVGAAISQGASAGVIAYAGLVAAEASSMVRKAITAAKLAAESNSPSKKMVQLGRDIDKGLILGIKELENDVSRTMEATLRKVVNTRVDVPEIEADHGVLLKAMVSANKENSQIEKIISALLSAKNSGDAPRHMPAQTVINLYPQTVDEGTIDYIYNRFSLRLGQEV